MKIEGKAADILRARSFPTLALVDEQGRPQATPVWVDLDDEGRAIVNTAEGRTKARLMKIGAPATLCAIDPDNPYSYVQIRGRVVERTHEEAWEMIDRLAQKYVGTNYQGPREQRVTLYIEADRVYEQ